MQNPKISVILLVLSISDKEYETRITIYLLLPMLKYIWSYFHFFAIMNNAARNISVFPGHFIFISHKQTISRTLIVFLCF
jgi:hypothetical protein